MKCAAVCTLLAIAALLLTGQPVRAQTSNTCFLTCPFVIPNHHVDLELFESGHSAPSRSQYLPLGGSGRVPVSMTWNYISTGRWYQLRVRDFNTGTTESGVWFYVFPGTTSLGAPTLYDW